MKTNTQLFDNPIKTKKVTNLIYAEQYRTGVIYVNGRKYIGYSLTAAIKKYKKEN